MWNWTGSSVCVFPPHFFFLYDSGSFVVGTQDGRFVTRVGVFVVILGIWFGKSTENSWLAARPSSLWFMVACVKDIEKILWVLSVSNRVYGRLHVFLTCWCFAQQHHETLFRNSYNADRFEYWKLYVTFYIWILSVNMQHLKNSACWPIWYIPVNFIR